MLMMNRIILFTIIVGCSEAKVDDSDDKPAVSANSESKNEDNNEDKDDDKNSPKPIAPTVLAVPSIPSLPPYRTSIFVLPLPASENEPQVATDDDTTTVRTSEVLATTVGQVFSVMINEDDQPSNDNKTISVKAYNGDTVVNQALVNINNITGSENFYNLSSSNPLPITLYLFFTAKALEDMVNRLVISIDNEKISEATIRLSANNNIMTVTESGEDLVFNFSPLPGGSAIYLRYFKLLAVDNNGQRSTTFDTIKDSARLQDEIDQQHYRLTIDNFPCQTGERLFAWQPENKRGDIVPSIERFYYQTTCP